MKPNVQYQLSGMGKIWAKKVEYKLMSKVKVCMLITFKMHH